MDRRRFLSTGSAALSAMVVVGKAAGKGSILRVQVSYTGAGTVDSSHKIDVALWDSPAFMKEGANPMRPLASKALQSKTATATFDDVQKSRVYVSLAYDPSGKWDAMSDPPVGSSLGIYAKTPGMPEAIALDPTKPTSIAVTFDDTYKKLESEKR